MAGRKRKDDCDRCLPPAKCGRSMKEDRNDCVWVFGFDNFGEKACKELVEWMEEKRKTVGAPSLSCELIRLQKTNQLRLHYKELCKRKLYWPEEPKSSLNRFLTDHLLLKASNEEPLLPTSKDIPENHKKWVLESRIYAEIEEDFPIKIKPPIQFVRGWHPLKAHILAYLKGCEAVLENHNAIIKAQDQMQLKEIISQVKQLHQIRSSPLDILERKYKKVRDEATPILQRILSPLAQEIVLELLAFSTQAAADILNDTLYSNEKPLIRTVGRKLVGVECEGKSFEITLEAFDALQRRIRFVGGVEKDEESLYIYVLLARYQAFIGEQYGAGGLHAALPSNVFCTLQEEFGVSIECFASPFNAYCDYFCSAFYDSDVPFGSLGSFFDFHPSRGSFEANPPFCELLMDRMVSHIHHILESSEEPLSFVVVVPDWKDASSYLAMAHSTFLRAKLLVKGKKHFYKSGLQHKVRQEKLYYAAVHDSRIFILQNLAGYNLWFPSNRKLNLLEDSFCR